MTRTIVCKNFDVPLGDERVAEPSDLKASDNNLSSFFTKRNLGFRIVSEAWCSPKISLLHTPGHYMNILVLVRVTRNFILDNPGNFLLEIRFKN